MLSIIDRKQPRLLDHFFNDGLFFDDFISKYNESGQNDIYETDENYVIDISLAGYNKDKFQLKVEDGSLVVVGERNKKNIDGKFTVKMLTYGKFEKNYRLPKDINTDKINAEYNDGILSITIPKEKKGKSIKTIEIK